jgi:hypothetical protein
MGDGGRLDHPRRLELDRPLETVEEADAVAQEHRNDVQLKLVEQPRPQVLLGDARAARERDVLVAGGRPGLVERGLDALRDERERRASLLDLRLAGVMSEDEDRNAERRLVAPPAVRPRVVLPRALPAADRACP